MATPIKTESELLWGIRRVDVVDIAETMGIAEAELTEDVMGTVEKAIPWGMEGWDTVVRTALEEALRLKKGVNDGS